MWTALTLLTLIAAFLVGIGKLLMPYSARYQPQLEAWLSEEFQQPVRLESFTGEWKAFGPRISMEGVTLLGKGEAQAEIAIQRAALDLRPLNGLLPGRPFYSFRIIGADMSLVRDADGRFALSGLGVSGRSEGSESDGGGLGGLSTVGELVLEDSSLSLTDLERGIELQLINLNGRLQLDGSKLSTDVEASVTDSDQQRVIGDFDGTLEVSLNEGRQLAEANWHIKIRELMLSELHQHLPEHPMLPTDGWLNGEMWGGWSKGSDQVMEGVLDLRESVLTGQTEPLALEHLNSRFRWKYRAKKAWRLDLFDVAIDTGKSEWETGKLTVERNLPGNLGIWVSADYLEIEFPLLLTQKLMARYESTWPRNAPRQASGRVHEFDMVLDGRWKLHMARGRFEDTSAWEWGRWPDVSGIRGEVDLLGGEGQVVFTGEGTRIDWPRNFRREAVVDIPPCEMEILWGDAWQIDARDCTVQHEDFELRGRSRFAKSENRPAVDVNVHLTRANLAELDDYWPASVMKPGVRNWLSRALVAGQLDSGRLVLTGDMDDWPFDGGEGRLEAKVVISEVDLDYVPAWPRAVRLNGEIRFLGSSMLARGHTGSLGGAPVQEFEARIADFRQPMLEFDYRSDTSLEQLAGFIEQTPLLDDSELELEQFGLEGAARTSGRLAVPLKAGGGPLQVQGTLDLDGNRFTERVSGVVLEDISGTVHYDREGIRADDLETRYRGHEATLAMAADWDGDEVFHADLFGDFPVAELLPASLLESEPMLRRIEGHSDWHVSLAVAGQTGPEPREIWLQMDSDLEGTSIGLPAPLDKAAEQAWPTRVRYPIKSASPVLSVAAQDRVLLQFDVVNGVSQPRSLGITLGSGPEAEPEPGQLTLAGNADLFDLDQWMGLVIERFREDGGAGALQFEGAELKTGELLFLNRIFEGVDISAWYEDDVLSGVFDSEKIKGNVRYTRSGDGSHSLTAELDHLVLGDPLKDGMSMDTDPAELPEMHFYANQFSYLGMDLGETRIEAYPVKGGLHIASLEATAPDLNFQARGDWIRDEQGERSDFDIVMTSESLGSLMSVMEISTVLQGGQTMLRYDAWWPGPPAAFALARLNGELGFSVVEGNIRTASPGAGRMVGLLSIAALPRRLALDFRDVFGSGFNFDNASGTVTLENGTAHTDDLVLESTAASVHIVGDSDLENREFNYLLTVRPGVGQTLPVIGAIAGGPGGAAAGLALQGLLQKSLGDAAEARYSISGPWSDPVVERLAPETTVEPSPETVIEPVTESTTETPTESESGNE